MMKELHNTTSSRYKVKSNQLMLMIANTPNNWSNPPRTLGFQQGWITIIECPRPRWRKASKALLQMPRCPWLLQSEAQLPPTKVSPSLIIHCPCPWTSLCGGGLVSRSLWGKVARGGTGSLVLGIVSCKSLRWFIASYKVAGLLSFTSLRKGSTKPSMKV